MKKLRFNSILKLFVAAMILLSIAGCVNAAQSNGAITVTLIDQDPYPVQAGQQVRFWIQIENTGTKALQNVTVQVVPKAPFSVSAGESSVTFKDLFVGSKQYHEFIMYVDSDATDGPRDLTVRYYSSDYGWVETHFNVSIGGIVDTTNRGTLIIDSVTSSPEVFMPGDEGIVWVTLKNNATAPTVSVQNKTYSTNARIQSASLYSKDGITVQSDPVNDLGIIAPGDNISIPFRVSIPEGTPDGTYLLTLNVSASSYEFNIKRNIELKVDSTGIKAIQSKQPGMQTIEIDIVNYHQGAIRGVTIVPIANGSTFYPTEYYIGDMKAGDLFTAKFNVTQSEFSSGAATFQAVYYNGDNLHADNVTLRLGPSFTVSGQPTRSLFSITNIVIFVAAVLVVLAAANFFLKKKKNVTLIDYIKNMRKKKQ